MFSRDYDPCDPSRCGGAEAEASEALGLYLLSSLGRDLGPRGESKRESWDRTAFLPQVGTASEPA